MTEKYAFSGVRRAGGAAASGYKGKDWICWKYLLTHRAKFVCDSEE